MMRRKIHVPAPGLTRRSLLAGVATCFASKALAQVPVPSAPRLVVMRASAIQAHLGAQDGPQSTLLRLAEPLLADIPANLRQTPGNTPATPVFRAKAGENLSIRLENALQQPMMLHARGMRGAPAMDGMPDLTGTPLTPGAISTVELPTRQSGTFILSPSLPAHMAEQNARGLNAVLIVEEAATQPVDHDIVLAMSDIRLDETGTITPDFNALRDAARVGRLGNRLVANGRPAPDRMSLRPNARIRVRLVNVANARVLPLRVSNLRAEVVAIDSTPCTPFDPLKRQVILSPGSRIEMILDAPEKPGEDGVIEARIGDGIPLMVFRTEGEPLPVRPKIQPLPDPGLPPAIRLQDATRADFTIAGGLPREAPVTDIEALRRAFPDPARIYTINGQPGGPASRPLARVPRGRVLVLAMTNRTAWPQVLAVHGHAFRLLHPFDDGWEPYFLDTLYLVPGTTARIALIADHPGRWAVRSTIAEHYASGVMGWFEVA